MRSQELKLRCGQSSSRGHREHSPVLGLAWHATRLSFTLSAAAEAKESSVHDLIPVITLSSSSSSSLCYRIHYMTSPLLKRTDHGRHQKAVQVSSSRHAAASLALATMVRWMSA